MIFASYIKISFHMYCRIDYYTCSDEEPLVFFFYYTTCLLQRRMLIIKENILISSTSEYSCISLGPGVKESGLLL